VKRWRLWFAQWLFEGIFPNPACFDVLGLEWQRQNREALAALKEQGEQAKFIYDSALKDRLAALEESQRTLTADLEHLKAENKGRAPVPKRAGSYSRFRQAVESATGAIPNADM
jgi:hypothetical protein